MDPNPTDPNQPVGTPMPQTQDQPGVGDQPGGVGKPIPNPSDQPGGAPAPTSTPTEEPVIPTPTTPMPGTGTETPAQGGTDTGGTPPAATGQY